MSRTYATGRTAESLKVEPAAIVPSWTAIDVLQSGDEIPEGARTVLDWARVHGLARKTAEEQLMRLVERGVLKTGRKRARCGSGMRTMNFYWPT